MARAATVSDPFNALGEPRRREILDRLARVDRSSVNDLVDALGLPQPAVSKHLGVLRKVGLVTVEKEGNQRFYALNAEPLKPVHAWVQTFERFWDDHLDAIKGSPKRRK